MGFNVKNKTTLGYLALTAGVVSGAFSSPLLRLILHAGVSEPTATFYRIFIAALALTPYQLLARKQRQQLAQCAGQGKTMLRLTMLGFFKAGTLVTQAFSLMSLEAFSFNTVYYLNPLIVMVLSYFFLKEGTPPMAIAGAVISIGGVVLATLGQMDLTGVLFAALSAAFYAGYIVTGRSIRGQLSTAVAVYVPLLFSAAIMYIMCRFMGVQLGGFELGVWLLLIGLGLVCTLLSQSMPILALGYLNSTTCSLFSLFSLVLAGGIAYFLLGETPTLRMVIGAGVLCAGMIVYLVADNKYHKRLKECGQQQPRRSAAAAINKED